MTENKAKSPEINLTVKAQVFLNKLLKLIFSIGRKCSMLQTKKKYFLKKTDGFLY